MTPGAVVYVYLHFCTSLLIPGSNKYNSYEKSARDSAETLVITQDVFKVYIQASGASVPQQNKGKFHESVYPQTLGYTGCFQSVYTGFRSKFSTTKRGKILQECRRANTWIYRMFPKCIIVFRSKCSTTKRGKISRECIPANAWIYRMYPKCITVFRNKCTTTKRRKILRECIHANTWTYRIFPKCITIFRSKCSKTKQGKILRECIPGNTWISR
jgi:hypothetical protein